MATRLYFPADEAAPITNVAPEGLSVPGGFGWADITQIVRRKLADTKGSSAITVGTRVQCVQGSGSNGHTLDRQYVSTRMAAGISFNTGTGTGQLMAREYANTDNVTGIVFGARILSEDGNTVRKTLFFATNKEATASELINNATHRNKTVNDGDPYELGAYTTVLGDRLVVELGFECASGTSPEASAKYGENATDLPVNETQTTDGAGWVEFSTNITFVGEVDYSPFVPALNRNIEQPYFGKTLIAPSGVRRATIFSPYANGFYRSITLDQPASDLTNFPVLITGTFSYLKTYANGGRVHDINGYDIVFYSDSGLTTKLDFERVYWNGTTGQMEFWVKIPTLTSASPTVIYMAYGKTSISSEQQNMAATWDSNFKGVWHLPNGTVLTAYDSKGVYNGTLSGNGGGIPNAAAGKIDGGADFNPNFLEKIDVGAGLTSFTNAITLECWAKIDTFISYNAVVSMTSNVSPYGGYQINIDADSGFNKFGAGMNINGVWQSGTVGSISRSTGVWYYLVLTYDGTTIRLYVNNGLDGSEVASGTINYQSLSTPMLIGNNGLNSALDGIVDEVRISDVVRSADWIAASYSNQDDPANFYTIGNETQA